MQQLTAAQIVDSMPQTFLQQRARGINLTIRLELAGEGGGNWQLTLADGSLRVKEGTGHTVSAVIKMTGRSFAEMMQGRADPKALQAVGGMEVLGLPAVATGLASLFNLNEQQVPVAKPGGMSGRQRVLAALRGLPVDRIPCALFAENYFLLGAPPEIAQGVIEAPRQLGMDIILRHVPVLQSADLGFLGALGSFRSPVEYSKESEGDRVVEKIKTPRGVLTGVSAFTKSVGWIPHPVKHAVETREDLMILRYAMDYLSPGDLSPAYEGFNLVDQAVGDDGIATPSLNNSPLMHAVETVAGLTHLYYLMQDEPVLVDEVLTMLAENHLKVVEAVAQSPAQVVVTYDNTSTTLLSPELFKKYCLPYLNASADILHSHGKIHLVHMCGKLRNLRDGIAAGRFDGIVDVSPGPTGDWPLDAAVKALPGKSVCGGIDATTFVSEDMEAVRAEVSGVIERAKPYRGVLLGSGDCVPRGARVENIRLIRELVETLGSYYASF